MQKFFFQLTIIKNHFYNFLEHFGCKKKFFYCDFSHCLVFFAKNRFYTLRKKQENHSKTQQKNVKQVASISAALNVKSAALARVHPHLPIYVFFFHSVVSGCKNLSFLHSVGSLTFNIYIILPVLNTIHDVSKFGYFFFTHSKNTSFSISGMKCSFLASWKPTKIFFNHFRNILITHQIYFWILYLQELTLSAQSTQTTCLFLT